MSTTKNKSKKTSQSKSDIKKTRAKKRGYDSPVRREQMAKTREHILQTAVKLVHESSSWNWKNLSASTVAESAGLGRRTVQRHFPSEKLLRDEVMLRLLTESGIALQQMSLNNFGSFIDQTFTYLSSFAAEPITPLISDPSLASMDQIRRDTMLSAVAKTLPSSSEDEKKALAALFDIFWHQPSFERLTTNWGLDTKQAIGLLSWGAYVLAQALKAGKRPKY